MTRRTKRLARMSPSNSGYWMNCPGWAQAVYGRGDSVTDPLGPAAEGTAAHSLFQFASIMGVPADSMLGAQIDAFTVDDDMADAVQEMLDWIAEWLNKAGESWNELSLKLVFDDYEMTGTADFIHWHEVLSTLTVADYKHGAGVWVDAELNTQVGLYILMVIAKLQKKPKHIYGVIGQPRAQRTGSDVIREHKWTDRDLTKLRERATLAIVKAHEVGAPRIAGTHCNWCAVGSTCRERAEFSLRTAMTEFKPLDTRPVIDPVDPASLTPDGLAYVQTYAPVISAWLREVQLEIQRRLMRHQPVAGFKLVAGRTMRKWINDAEVLKAVKQHGLNPTKFVELIVLSPAQTEKRLKKLDHPDALDDRIKALTTKTTPPLHVVPESDPRPALVGTASLDFKPIEGE